MSQTRRISGVVAAVGIVSLCALQSFNDMRRCGGPPLSANITETQATFGITVGRWR